MNKDGGKISGVKMASCVFIVGINPYFQLLINTIKIILGDITK